MRLLAINRAEGTARQIGKVITNHRMTMEEIIETLGGEILPEEEEENVDFDGERFYFDDLETAEDTNLTDEEKIYLLMQDYCTEKGAKKYVKDGAGFYEDTEEGYKDFEQECIACLNDPEDVPEMWEKMRSVDYLDVFRKRIKTYRYDVCL